MTVKLLQEVTELDGLVVRKLEIIQEGDYINVAVSSTNKHILCTSCTSSDHVCSIEHCWQF